MFKQNTKWFFHASILMALMTLTGCFVPEKFDSFVEFHSDGSYRFTYQGTLVHALAAEQIKKMGHLSPGDENLMRQTVGEIKKDACVKDAAYEGDAHFRIRYVCDLQKGQPFSLFGGIITIQTGKDGTILIDGKKMTENDRRQLLNLGIKVDGTFTVNLPAGAKVLSQNADSTPTFGFGGYSWKIGGIDRRPAMQIKL